MTGMDRCLPAKRRLYFDVTRHSRQSHHSGLKRVSNRLQHALMEVGGHDVIPVKWSVFRRRYVCSGSGVAVNRSRPQDIFFTAEVFSLRERPFMRRWLSRFRGQTGRIFYDAIPFLHPDTTWPRSVRRFPAMLADLQAFNKVFYISAQARKDALSAGDKLGLPVPEGSILTLGSDYAAAACGHCAQPLTTFLQVGILEPRKGQDILLDACEELWRAGHVFKLVLLGRVNPHFGQPIVSRIRQLRSQGMDILHLPDADDSELAEWHRRAGLLVSPSLAEGFGLPVLEALWAGCPALASRQPACELLRDGAGCRIVDPVDSRILRRHLGHYLEHPEELDELRQQIDRATLPLWRETADQLLEGFPLAT